MDVLPCPSIGTEEKARGKGEEDRREKTLEKVRSQREDKEERRDREETTGGRVIGRDERNIKKR